MSDLLKSPLRMMLVWAVVYTELIAKMPGYRTLIEICHDSLD